MIQLALAAGIAESELKSPMATVVLGGLTTAAFLNLVVVLTLSVKWKGKSVSAAEAQ